MNPIVYISYVKADEALAVEIASNLDKYHIPCYLGEESVISKEKLASLDCMKVMVFLFSKDSLNSNIIDNEITTAINNQVPIVPFQVDRTYIKENRSLDFMLQKSQWVLGYPNLEKQMDNLIVSVCRFMGVDAIQKNPTDPFEQLKRGIALEYGTNGLSRDRQEAMLWLVKSAENGNFMAMFELYKFYVNSEDGNDTYDYAKAKDYLIMAADCGLAEAQYRLGTCYEVYDELIKEYYVNLLPDVSMPLCIKKDIDKAIYYYEQASRQGYKKAQGLPDATILLGKMYETGDGVEKDMKKAKDCFKRATIQYNSIAEYNKIVNRKDKIDI